MLYLIPSNKEEVKVTQQLEYVFPNDLEAIYLLDNNDYISRTTISVNGKNELSKSKDLIEGLTVGGKKQDIIPNGFKSLLPRGTKILDIIDYDSVITLKDKDKAFFIINAIDDSLQNNFQMVNKENILDMKEMAMRYDDEIDR